jgi:hypothetical protein
LHANQGGRKRADGGGKRRSDQMSVEEVTRECLEEVEEAEVCFCFREHEDGKCQLQQQNDQR